MKKMLAICCAMLLTACISLTGCGKEETVPAPEPAPTPTSLEQTAGEAIETVGEKIEEVTE